MTEKKSLKNISSVKTILTANMGCALPEFFVKGEYRYVVNYYLV